MNETELERLVVRIYGDGSSYQKMMTDAVQHTTTAANQVQAAGKQIEGVSKSLQGFASAAITALASFGLATSLKGAFEMFSDFERTQIRIKAGIESSGQAVDTTLAHYKALTKELMSNTAASKIEIMGLIEKAQNMGKTGQAIDNVTKNSLAFAAATGKGAEEGFRLALAMEMGNVHMLKHALGLRFVKDETEVMRIAQQRLAAGYKVLDEQNKTASVQLEKLGRAFKETSIEVGGMVAQALTPFLKIATNIVETIKTLSPETKQWIVYVTAGTLAFLALGPAISTAMFLMDALGINFVINTALQLTQLALSGAAWLLWGAITTGVSLAFTAALFVTNAALTLLSLGVSAAGLVFTLFGGNVALSILSLVSWSTVVTIAKGITWLFFTALNLLSFVYTALTFGIPVAGAAMQAWTFSAIAAKLGTWLLNAALTAMNVLLFGIPIAIGVVVVALIALVGAIGLAVAGVAAFTVGITVIGVVTATVSGVIAALVAILVTTGTVLVGIGSGLWDVVSGLKAIQGSIGGIEGIKAVFWDWFGIIKDIVRAAQTDLPLAWALAKAAFWLAVAEMKAAWTPLWSLITETATITTTILWKAFSSVFDKVGKYVSNVFNQLWPLIQAGWAVTWQFVSTSFSILLDLLLALGGSGLKQIPYLLLASWLTTNLLVADLFIGQIKDMAEGYVGLGKLIKDVMKSAVNPLADAPDIKKYLNSMEEADRANLERTKKVAKVLEDVFNPQGELDKQKKALANADKAFGQAGANAKKGFADAFNNFNVPPPDFLKDLQGQLEAAQAQLKASVAKFAAAGIANSPEITAARAEVDRIRGEIGKREIEKAKLAGVEAGGAFNKGVKGKSDELKAILYGTADTLAHIADYNESLRKIKAPTIGQPGQPVGGGNLPAAPPIIPPPQANPAQLAGDGRREILLRSIWNVLAGMAQKQGVVVQPLNLGGA